MNQLTFKADIKITIPETTLVELAFIENNILGVLGFIQDAEVDMKLKEVEQPSGIEE